MNAFFRSAAGSVLLGAAASFAAPPLPGHVLGPHEARPRIDGRLDDAVWREVPAFEAFRQFRPDSRPDAGAYRTRVQVLVEPNALVFAITAIDPEPQRLRAPLLRRDQVWPDQDSVTVWLDAMGRQQVAQVLRVNPAGVVADGLYTAATDEEDDTPDFLEVEAAAQRTPEGYTAEIRWPLINLRYAQDGGLPWRFAFERRVPRETPLSLTSTGRERQDANALRDMHTLDALSTLPPSWLQASHLRVKAEGTWRRTYGESRTQRTNLGLALQWRPRADWVLDGLWRPDFSQDDLDAPQLSGNTQFALFLPEKRAFFLESSDVMGQQPPDPWGLTRGLAAFYSRAVAAPRSGLRATWRGVHDEATALLMRDQPGGTWLRPGAYATDRADSTLPSTLLFARHRWGLGADGGTGALAPLVSLRDWGAGRRTAVTGFDGLWHLNETQQLSGHALWSQDSTDLDPEGRLQRARARHSHNAWLLWRHRGEHWRVNAHWESIGADFVNDNGFVPQAGIRRATLETRYALHPEADATGAFALTELEGSLRLQEVRTLSDARRGVPGGETVGQALQPGWFLLGASGTELWGHVNLQRLRARTGGELHAARSLSLGVGAHPGPRLAFVNLELEAGRLLDVDADRVVPGANASLFVSYRQSIGGWGLLAEWQAARSRLQSPAGGWALSERSNALKLVLLPSAAHALRLVHQRTRSQRADELGLGGWDDRERTSTLTWLAREGPLRNWSVGASHARPAGEPQARTELFVKWQEGGGR